MWTSHAGRCCALASFALVLGAVVPEVRAVRAPDMEVPGVSRAADEPPPPAAVERDQVVELDLPGAPREEDAIAAAVERVLADNAGWLGGVAPGALRRARVVTATAEADRPAITSVQLVQTAQGLDVEGSYVHTSVKLLAGRSVLVVLRARLYPALTLPSPAARAPSALRERGARRLGLDPVQAKPVRERRILRYVGGRWRRVQAFQYSDRAFTAVVDEDSEDSWLVDERRSVINLYLHGTVGSTAPGAARTDVPFSDVTVTREDTGTTKHTDGSGWVDFSPGEPITLSWKLRGSWAKVLREDKGNYSDSIFAHPGDTWWVAFWRSPDNDLDLAERNAYWHPTVLNNWILPRNLLLALLISVQLPVHVNYPNDCNAYYLPGVDEIELYRAYGGCINTAYDTIIYHEFGHFVDDQAGGIMDGGLSEGWGDVLATYITGQPIIGANITGPGTYVRTADNNRLYNPFLEVHDLGEAWAGFGWHMRQNLVAVHGAYGAGLAESLMLHALLVNSANIPAGLTDVLLWDDNDANFGNCTPHSAQILQAARRHGIPLPPGLGGCC
jgi:hypothetical protein